jgi:hypothetical protein
MINWKDLEGSGSDLFWGLHVEVEVILRPKVSRQVCLGIGHPPAAHDQILITVGRLQFPSRGSPSLTRGRVCNLIVLVLLCLTSFVTLGSKSRRSWDHILLSHLRLGSLSVAPDSHDYSGGNSILTRVFEAFDWKDWTISRTVFKTARDPAEVLNILLHRSVNLLGYIEVRIRICRLYAHVSFQPSQRMLFVRVHTWTTHKASLQRPWRLIRLWVVEVIIFSTQ